MGGQLSERGGAGTLRGKTGPHNAQRTFCDPDSVSHPEIKREVGDLGGGSRKEMSYYPLGLCRGEPL